MTAIANTAIAMSETKHGMKLRHKAELKALQSAPAKGIGAKKIQKDDERLMLARHEQELKDLEVRLAAVSVDADTDNQAHPPSLPQSAESAPAPAADAKAATPSKSRAQLKRDKKLEQENARRAEIIASVADMHDPRTDENASIAAKLAPRSLTVKEIISDGHCLFRAIAHQLNDSQVSHESLRSQAASHIRAHLPEYQPFLVSEDGEPFSDSEASRYCDDLGRGDGQIVWGGHAEIVALSDLLHRTIIVHSADGQDLVVDGMAGSGSGSGGDDDSALHISFHKYYFGLGNHYNSVIKADDDNDDDGGGAR